MKKTKDHVDIAIAASLDDWNERCDFYDKKEALNKLNEIYRENEEMIKEFGGFESIPIEVIEKMLSYEKEIKDTFILYKKHLISREQFKEKCKTPEIEDKNEIFNITEHIRNEIAESCSDRIMKELRWLASEDPAVGIDHQEEAYANICLKNILKIIRGE